MKVQRRELRNKQREEEEGDGWVQLKESEIS